ncbi:hypothetical protein EVAR_79296_1 [Eumeta japonica]|uniref:Uncharacterized protein n=1 Tax=Eumeta variegata TaxID=151549 RepID=A0A4C1TFN5_EUMVA|nr:hypothetical protein EVAR_79296_1 [Eumeta japonica]
MQTTRVQHENEAARPMKHEHGLSQNTDVKLQLPLSIPSNGWRSTTVRIMHNFLPYTMEFDFPLAGFPMNFQKGFETLQRRYRVRRLDDGQIDYTPHIPTAR